MRSPKAVWAMGLGAVATAVLVGIALRRGTGDSSSEHLQLQVSPSLSATRETAPIGGSIGESGRNGSRANATEETTPAPRTLSEAIARYAEAFSNTSGTLDLGSARLTLWAAQNGLDMSALRALPATSTLLFRRDPQAERGKLLCVSGVISDIRAERSLARRLVRDQSSPLVTRRSTAMGEGMPGAENQVWSGANAVEGNSGSRPISESPRTHDSTAELDPEGWRIPGGPVYFATITETVRSRNKPKPGPPLDNPLVVAAIAIGSAASLVDGDAAKFCGVLTGVDQTDLPSGSLLRHRLIGVFEPTAPRGDLAAGPHAAE
ncbi:MAG TPA: hypothetical protein VFQ61_21085 [Polyangiaceae bacterium]|nr:hypothetical protein [Polyangiaceae bacterium]